MSTPPDDAQLRVLAAQAAITKMLSDTHFSICTMRAVATTLKRIPDPDADAILDTLHCVHYKDMPTELRGALPQLIARYLGTPWPPPAPEQNAYTRAPEPRRPSLLARLVTRSAE